MTALPGVALKLPFNTKKTTKHLCEFQEKLGLDDFSCKTHFVYEQTKLEKKQFRYSGASFSIWGFWAYFFLPLFCLLNYRGEKQDEENSKNLGAGEGATLCDCEAEQLR